MDCILEFFKDWEGHILSSLGIIGGISAYSYYNRKTNQSKQSSKADEEKMADFYCNISHRNEDSIIEYIINFKNIGKADARNVRIEILDSGDNEFEFVKYEWDYNIINSGQLISEPIKVKHSSQPFKMMVVGVTQLEIKITWDDKYSKNRSRNLSLYFPAIVQIN